MSKPFVADQVRLVSATLKSTSLATRGLLTQTDNLTGIATAIQPFLGQGSFAIIQPSFGAAGFTGIGMAATADGTPTIRIPAPTNFCTSLQRGGIVSVAGAGSAAGLRCARLGWWRGNGAGLGGFFGLWRFNVSDAVLVGTANMFVGMRATNGTIVDVVPSTLTNIIGVGCDTGDTNLQLYAAGAAAQARTSLGVNFPVNTTNVDVYELVLFAAPNGVDIKWQITRVNTGDTASGTINNAAQLPSNTTFLEPTAWRGNGATAAAIGIDIETIYLQAPR